ncbi:DUF1275 domain-containing protein [Sphingomonas sp. CFBP 13728]|uniref:YoaK family protein n=1 Tax=unclassified Sphingomonas TaxID=196159 RepID=UPI001786D275|nr:MULTISPECIES: YoaK family protein [unclassified Sphingomonas]MBD8620853.1 DUF1275 domain-containing protein [Sphingomonas sp. CFBP 13728]MBD8737171.1 DUF1275 domain-containing protein [Sphingomonas sp. CFBP 13706]
MPSSIRKSSSATASLARSGGDNVTARSDPGGHDGRTYALAFGLLAVAGAVDAIGFLHFHTFYVSFMSGNTTRVALALAQTDWSLATQGAMVIAAFVVGVVAGELLIGAAAQRRPLAMVVEAVTVLLAAGFGSGLTSSVLLALAMGMQNALILRAEGVGMALTYVTGTLVHVGRGIAAVLAGRRGWNPIWPYAGMLLALTLGAVAGTAAMRWGEANALIAIAMCLTILTIPARQRRKER